MLPNIRLPAELCDHIIDHLWDDLSALRACSLTCKDWLPSSRFHLFRNVRLRHADDVQRFRALLASTPSVALCVRKLSFSADYDGATPDGVALEDDAWVNDVVDILRLLQNVTTLALARVRWHALHEETRAAFEALSRTVHELFLFEVSFKASRDVIAFLSSFPTLRDLYFDAVSWAEDSPTPFDAPSSSSSEIQDTASRMQLSYLFLDPKSSPTLVTEWLLRRPEGSEPRLQNIQLCWRDLTDTKPLGDLLRASGASLEALQIEFPDGLPFPTADADAAGTGADAPAAADADADALADNLSLAHNTGLRALHFAGLRVDPRAPAAAGRLFPWVAAMLARVHARQLRELTFTLEVARAADLAALDWARVDALLGGEAFRGLAVAFVVTCDEDGVAADVRREIAARLPAFRLQGSLSVSCF